MAVSTMALLAVAGLRMAEWRVACDGETLAWQRRGWTGSEAGEQRLAGNDPAALSTALQDVLASRARRGDSLCLALGSHHIRIAALAWPAGRLSAAEQQALLHQRWRERLDDADDCWLGVEDAGTVRLATAVRQDLLQRLLDATAACGVRPRACLPAAGLVLRHVGRAADIRIELDEGSRQTVMSVASGRLVGLNSGWRGPPGSGASGSARPGDTVGTPSDDTAQATSTSHAIRLDGGPRGWLEWF